MKVHGKVLRQLRAIEGLTQADLAEMLGIRRTSLSNIEAGRDAPSERLVGRLVDLLPHWRPALEQNDPLAMPPVLGGPFTLDELVLTYVFLEAEAPSEVIEARRVTATRAGACAYVSSSGRTRSESSDPVTFHTETQALWGGYLVDEEYPAYANEVHVLRRLNFGRTLRRGEHHSFAVRTWVERDPDPDTSIEVSFTIPAERVELHIACHGSLQLEDAWSFGPSGTDSDPASRITHPLTLTAGGTVSVTFDKPALNKIYGLGWKWQSLT